MGNGPRRRGVYWIYTVVECRGTTVELNVGIHNTYEGEIWE